MIFSKSFGYALRSVLYVAVMQDEKQYVQAEEIALSLSVPRHFIGKILKRLAKEKILSSIKGPSGGFTLNKDTLQMRLLDLMMIIDGMQLFDNCTLRVNECNAADPCPIHFQMENVKSKLKSILTDTTIGDLLGNNKLEFIKSISTNTSLTIFQQQKKIK